MIESNRSHFITSRLVVGTKHWSNHVRFPRATVSAERLWSRPRANPQYHRPRLTPTERAAIESRHAAEMFLYSITIVDTMVPYSNTYALFTTLNGLPVTNSHLRPWMSTQSRALVGLTSTQETVSSLTQMHQADTSGSNTYLYNRTMHCRVAT